MLLFTTITITTTTIITITANTFPHLLKIFARHARQAMIRCAEVDIG